MSVRHRGDRGGDGLEVSPEDARRIALRAQLLDGSASDVRATVRALGFLQLDPIATVATPQELVLWSRLGTHDRDELDRLLWRSVRSSSGTRTSGRSSRPRSCAA